MPTASGYGYQNQNNQMYETPEPMGYYADIQGRPLHYAPMRDHRESHFLDRPNTTRYR